MSIEKTIAMIIVIAVLLIAIAVLLSKQNPKRRLLSFVRKNHTRQIAVLLDKDEVNSNDYFSAEEEDSICSLSIEEWKHWGELIEDVKKVALKYTYTFDIFVDEQFPQLKSRKCVLKSQNESLAIKRLIWVESMTPHELSLTASETEDNWALRIKQNEQASIIRSKYSDGYAIYCNVKKNSSPSAAEIIRNQHSIASYEASFNKSIIYDGWEEKQKEFCDTFYELCKEHRKNDGSYTYYVKFNHIDKYGKMIESGFMVRDGFISSYSREYDELLPEHMIKTKKQLPEWEWQRIRYYDHVYDGLFNVIDGLREKLGSKPLVVFVNSSRFAWQMRAYKYHYKYLQNTLSKNEYEYIDLESISNIGNNSIYKAVILIDLITHNDDLVNNCRIIAEFFSKHQPYIAYYSYIKEHSKQEIEQLYKKQENETELQKIEFVKKMFLRVNKHSFFSYIAITNTLIGNARDASTIKKVWLDNPSKYHLNFGNCTDMIRGIYTVDGNLTNHSFNMLGSRLSIDDVAKYSYKLFVEMGIWDQFRLRGENAIDHMNSLGLLSKHL